VTLVNGINPSPPTQTVRPQAWSMPQTDPWPALAATDNAALSSGPGRSWNNAQRTLSVTGSYTLPAGTYSVCSLTLGNGSALSLAGPVKLYIDSPDRPGSGCAAASGYVRAQNSNGMNWPSGATLLDASVATAARNLHVFVYGNDALDDPASHPTFCGDGNAWGSFVFCHAGGFAGVVYSPNGRIYFGQSMQVAGALAADRIYLNQSVGLRFPSGLTSGMGSSDLYGIRDWTECAANGTGTTC
jgi:hypothetical protein